MWDILLRTLWIGLSVLAAAHAVMYKRDPKGAALWLIISFALPIVGPWSYWVFGINRIERRAARRLVRRTGGRERPLALPGNMAVHAATDDDLRPVAHLTGLKDVGDRVTRLPLLVGNSLQPLHNGERAYPVMREAIRSATRSITLTSYIFDWDEIGRAFAAELADAANRGVRVHVLVDGVGAQGNFSRMGRFLLKSGVQVAAFAPIRFPFGRLRLNMRNHRKILVVDGAIGFTGGMNITKHHLAEQKSPDRIEDLHFQILGPVVAELQQAFVDDWLLATGNGLDGELYFPPLTSQGEALARGISSGPDETLDNIHWVIQAALAEAQREVRIVTPYFVPSQSLTSAMSMAALRGVQVTLFLPSKLDHQFMRWAADAYLWQLLEHGVRVIRRRPPFVHTKLMVVDDRWTLLGSANLDPRSFRLNFEFNVEAYDETLAKNLTQWLRALEQESEQVTLQAMDERTIPVRLRDGVVKLFSPWL